MKTIENQPTLFFVNQDPDVVEQFRTWLIGTGVQCVVVEPIARAFSLVVRDDPWGVVLRIDEPVGEKLCAQIREDDLLEELTIIALSRGTSSSQLTEHMFGPSSADVYGKIPLEDGMVDVWLRNQLGVSDESLPSRLNTSSVQSTNPGSVSDIDEDDEDEVAIELTADLSVSSPSSTPRPDSTMDERISRLELELFEQSEKMTLINRNLLKSQLALQESTSHNAMLQAEFDRLSAQLIDGNVDEVLRNEYQRLVERLQIAEQALEKTQKSDVDIGLQEVESLSPQDLLGQIAALRQSRDEKIEQVNALHGELQLTRQAVKGLQSRTQKAEDRLTEAQDVGQLREQQMQREFVSLQRQVSNGTRNLEVSNHRERQLSQQVAQMQARLQDIERLHQEERDHWLQKIGSSSGESQKEAELLLEIEGLTQALQAQLMGDADGSETVQLIESLEGRINSSQTEINQLRTDMIELEQRNSQLTQKLTAREQDVVSEESAQWKEQQQVLDDTIQALEQSLMRQDDLEQQLAEKTLNTERLSEEDNREWELTTQRLEEAESLNASLQEQLMQTLDEMESFRGQESSLDSTPQQVLSLEEHNAKVEALHTKYRQDLERVQNTSNPTSGSEQMVLDHLQKAISEIESQRKFIEEELEEAHAQVRKLTDEQTRLQCALEDSQSMSDAVEALTDEELAAKTAEVREMTEVLQEREQAYQELEAQTALVIGERDDMWSRIEDMSAKHTTLQSELQVTQQEKSGLEQDLAESQESLSQQAIDIEELRLQVGTIDADLSKKNEELLQWQTQAAENHQAKEALELENQALSDQRQVLLTEQKELQDTADGLRSTVSDLTAKIDAVTSDSDILKSEMQSLSEQMTEANVILDAKSTELEESSSRLEGLLEEKEGLQSALQSLKDELADLRIETDRKAQELTQVTEEHQTAIETLTTAHTEQLSSQSAEFETQMAELHATHQHNISQTQQALAEWETKHQHSENQLTSTQDSLRETEDSLGQQQQENQRLQEHLAQLQSQIDTDTERNQLQESEQVVSLTNELQQVRTELGEVQQTSDGLRSQLATLQDELERLRTVEAELSTLQERQRDLLAELNQVKTDWSVAESNWQTERAILQAEYEGALAQAEQDASILAQVEDQVNTSSTVEHASKLELELKQILEQRAQLLAEIETWTQKYYKQESLVKELRQTGSTLVAELQVQRDDAQAELEMLRLEMGIVQSAARQLAQQAERTRRDVLTQESSWQKNLTEKEAENDRLRARIERMERGLSSLFVKRPTF